MIHIYGYEHEKKIIPFPNILRFGVVYEKTTMSTIQWRISEKPATFQESLEI